MSSSPLRWWRLAVPKRGHRPDEYEDSAVGDGTRGRFAIADGATESAFAGNWSMLLAEAFVRESVLNCGWDAWLPEVRRRWTTVVSGRDMPWYLEEKVKQGAFATLLGLELNPMPTGDWEWKSIAVGDCCLFQVRSPELVCSFPIEHAAEFNATPELIGSRNAQTPRDQRARGRARPRDVFLLASDALSAWLLREHENNSPPWQEVMDIVHGPDPETNFPRWVEALWEQGALKVDDVTLLAIELPAAESIA